MKRILLAGIVCLFSGLVMAAPGDTTWVQAHSNIQMDHFGNFDTTIEFPDGSVSYRKIIMTFTLGKYMCPGNPQYCGDWDYTLSVHLLPKSGDTTELGRFISPYANANSPRTPWTWTQRYEFDVTDFYNELRDSSTLRIRYSGYSWGFTGDVKFAMIEGTRPRDVLGMKNAWGTSSRYGDTSQATQIEDRIDTVSLTAPTGTTSAELKLTISGHGSDDNGCSEFCRKFYEVELNGNKFDKTVLWRDDCGYNHMYPQSGTWVYDRGNWCPGDVVFPNRHILSGITGGSNFDLDVDFEDYIGSINGNNRSWGSYTVYGNVFYYGPFNKNLDASLENIVAPTDHETYFRYNPATGSPIVIVQNTGSITISSIKFKYEIAGGTGVKDYTWNGTLESLDTAWVELPPYNDLGNATGANNTFDIEIETVNGIADDDATNNKLSSNFTAAVRIPGVVFVHVKTNNKGNETSWEIYDMTTNTLLAERDNMASNTIYRDTLVLLEGMYKLVVHDLGCNGLNWWAAQGDGSGFIGLKNAANGLSVPLDGYFSGDFGCGFTQYFNSNWKVGIDEVKNDQSMQAFPNPATDNIMILLQGMPDIDGTLLVKDLTGRTVITRNVNQPETRLDVSALTNGMYTIMYMDNKHQQAGMVTKVVVAR